MQLQIKPLSPETVEDFFTFFDKIAFADHPEWGCGCYCCMFHAPDPKAWEENTPARNAALAVAASAQWVANFAVSTTFPPMSKGLGLGASYSVYAAFAALSNWCASTASRRRT